MANSLSDGQKPTKYADEFYRMAEYARGRPQWSDLALEIREHIMDEVVKSIFDCSDTLAIEAQAFCNLAGISFKINQEGSQRPIKIMIENISIMHHEHSKKRRRSDTKSSASVLDT